MDPNDAAQTMLTLPGGGAGAGAHASSVLRKLLPALVFPGLIYLVASRFVPTVVALSLASAPPAVDVLVGLARRRAPNPASIGFLALATVSVGLALWSGSTLFILARGAVVSGVLGLAFAISAAVRRPLTRTLAVRLVADAADVRGRLAERWASPKALRIFRVISLGWGALLLLQAAQQAIVVATLSPGTVVALEPPIQAVATVAGIAATLMYARRMDAAHPEVGLLRARG